MCIRDRSVSGKICPTRELFSYKKASALGKKAGFVLENAPTELDIITLIVVSVSRTPFNTIIGGSCGISKSITVSMSQEAISDKIKVILIKLFIVKIVFCMKLKV